MGMRNKRLLRPHRGEGFLLITVQSCSGQSSSDVCPVTCLGCTLCSLGLSVLSSHQKLSLPVLSPRLSCCVSRVSAHICPGAALPCCIACNSTSPGDLKLVMQGVVWLYIVLGDCHKMFSTDKLSCSRFTLVLTSFQMQTVQIGGRRHQSWKVQADSSSQGQCPRELTESTHTSVTHWLLDQVSCTCDLAGSITGPCDGPSNFAFQGPILVVRRNGRGVAVYPAMKASESKHARSMQAKNPGILRRMTKRWQLGLTRQGDGLLLQPTGICIPRCVQDKWRVVTHRRDESGLPGWDFLEGVFVSVLEMGMCKKHLLRPPEGKASVLITVLRCAGQSSSGVCPVTCLWCILCSLGLSVLSSPQKQLSLSCPLVCHVVCHGCLHVFVPELLCPAA
nr:uncharacterized protein LOC115495198 isoform X1 [Taeniopygia guttata]XP_041572036.1 uncharacterized protein LOC115495198 isoform X1 [Taeniopygia guttata]XP_041572037.1 uncharacterized protein LOC115495198 isoform X1 [Taeniopygia guttata]XP_041572038.1 uncharacterized protein LOC115495198 isoform X1 [Taeniopygia guttata]XP_041572039.1 uncharacterized protein LOC115495198 isoform X1 [Taeniopygia guttata]XP_041572040.1 uncharacterized protein LOC115495198 isoform X1 [Taeniopygia guttata]XP_04